MQKDRENSCDFLRMYADPAKPALSNYLYDRQWMTGMSNIRETS